MLNIEIGAVNGMPPAGFAGDGLEQPPANAKSWSERVDVAVIGGGITGLSAAYHLAGAARVAVLEAHQFGSGASGRAFGQVVPYLKHGTDKLIASYGRERGERIARDVAAGPDLVFDLIARHGIACQAFRTGLLCGARDTTGLAGLEVKARECQGRGARVEMLDATATAAAIGSDLYCGALLDKRGGHLNPLAYTRGLGRAAAEQGVLLHSGCSVDGLTRSPAGTWEIAVSGRRLVADAVVIASNAHTSGLWPGLERTIVPLRVHGAMTEPLSTDMLSRILPFDQSLTDTRRLYSGVRKLGSRLHLTLDGPLFGTKAARPTTAQARLAELFPWLPMPTIIEQWHGWIALSPDQLPKVHELAPGLWAGLGYSGRGLAAATMIGRDIAWRVLGRSEVEMTFPLTRPRPLPSRTAAALAVASVVTAYRLLDRLDARRASVSRQWQSL